MNWQRGELERIANVLHDCIFMLFQEVAEPLQDLKEGMDQLEKNKTLRYILTTLLAIGNFLNSTNVSHSQDIYGLKVPVFSLSLPLSFTHFLYFLPRTSFSPNSPAHIFIWQGQQ